VRPLGTLVQICGNNRARQRDKLAHLLEEFAGLQDEVSLINCTKCEILRCFVQIKLIKVGLVGCLKHGKYRTALKDGKSN
jgi:hypothetical protein